jgi:phosphate starvation-inducible PhoH-like protein
VRHRLVQEIIKAYDRHQTLHNGDPREPRVQRSASQRHNPRSRTSPTTGSDASADAESSG